MRGVPIHLGASVTLPTTVGPVVTAGLAQLQMVHRSPIEITEIHFGSFAPDPTIKTVPGMLGMALDAGPYKLTAGFVPLWAVDPNYNSDYQEATSAVRWILPTPMVLPAGYVLRPRFAWLPHATGISGYGAISLNIGIVGRTLVGGAYPRTTRVPYVSTWQAAVGDTQSKQLDLINDLDKTIRVHRLIGHISAGLGSSNGNGDLLDMRNTIEDVIDYRFAIRKSTGYMVTQDPVPAMALFPPQQRALSVEQDLARGESYIITSPTAATAFKLPAISFVASRVEAI